ncbi:hypothetical protein L2E82_05961 [Cichorium intybus]|uniref:Uncharacterized protein n=1 Tax=Cichorium intybus TaxID=13427 RepID=A0ACB9H9U4_CICIN|nr:hypothetical protein L2E82_05961 [Cichorium intybus]
MIVGANIGLLYVLVVSETSRWVIAFKSQQFCWGLERNQAKDSEKDGSRLREAYPLKVALGKWPSEKLLADSRKTLADSGASKHNQPLNGNLTKNRKNKIRKKVKKAT